MGKRFVKVALCQRSGFGKKEDNLHATVQMIEEACANCPDLDVIVFPEYNYYVHSDMADAHRNAETVNGPYITAMKKLAHQYHVNLLPGSFAELASGEKVRNSCVFINRQGEVIGKYSKIHLMDAIGSRESDSTEPGDQLCVLDADFGRIGIMVCFDLRFPELPRSMVLQGADILFCPANFPFGHALPPRTDHWDTLITSTALYNLTWVCAVNQYGVNGNEHPFGRTGIVDPWGTKIAAASNHAGIVYGTLDMDYQKTVRDSVATWKCRRPDIYQLG